MRGEPAAALPAADDAATEACSTELAAIDVLLAQDHEIPSILRALDGGFVRPAPGGDLLRTPAILPTGRNLHGFDPFRIPSALRCRTARARRSGCSTRTSPKATALPESVAIVLWGTDNLKTEGGPIAQALALIGAGRASTATAAWPARS